MRVHRGDGAILQCVNPACGRIDQWTPDTWHDDEYRCACGARINTGALRLWQAGDRVVGDNTTTGVASIHRGPLSPGERIIMQMLHEEGRPVAPAYGDRITITRVRHLLPPDSLDDDGRNVPCPTGGQRVGQASTCEASPRQP